MLPRMLGIAEQGALEGAHCGGDRRRGACGGVFWGLGVTSRGFCNCFRVWGTRARLAEEGDGLVVWCCVVGQCRGGGGTGLR